MAAAKLTDADFADDVAPLTDADFADTATTSALTDADFAESQAPGSEAPAVAGANPPTGVGLLDGEYPYPDLAPPTQTDKPSQAARQVLEFGDTLSPIEGTTAAMGAGFESAPAALRGIFDYAGYAFYNAVDPIIGTNYAKELYAPRLQAIGNKLSEASQFAALAGGAPGEIAANLGQQLPTLPIQLLSAGGASAASATAQSAARNAVSAMSAMGGLQSASQAFSSNVSNRVSQGEQLQAAADEEFVPSLASGLITAGVTKAFGSTGLESVFRNEGAKGAARKVFETLKQGGFEVAEEVIDESGQIINDLVNGKGVTPDEAMKRVGMAATAAAIMGTGVVGMNQILARNDAPLTTAAAREAETSPETISETPTPVTTAPESVPSEAVAKETAEIETPPAETSVVSESLSTSPEVASTTLLSDLSKHPIAEVPLEKITLSKDVPNFKEGADVLTGETEPLSGTYERLGTGPVVLWERLNGDMEAITGRHRLALARRSGEQSIPSQIVREADGFTKEQAMTFDAEANIRDGQGSVGDYANYIRNSEISEAEASSRGLLARDKGRAGFAIGRNASDDLYALYRDGKVSDTQARAIAEAAPGADDVQRVGIRAALEGKPAAYIRNLIKAAQARGGESAKQLDLLGNDDAVMVQMDAQAKAATKAQKEIADSIRAVEGAAKNPALAAKEGVDVKDPASVQRRVAELKAERERWDNWPMHPDLLAKTRGEVAPAVIPKLRPGEKGTGDLLQGDDAPFNLMGEKGADTLKRAEEQAAADRASAEAKAKFDREQGEMFGAGTKSGPLLPNTTSSAPVVPVKAMSEIIRDIAKGINVPIRFGRLTTNKFAGYFKQVQNLIGAKNANDMSIVSHETGHKLDDSFGISKMPALRAELDVLGDPSTPGSRSSWTPSKSTKYKHGEGVAEFVRHWLTDPAKAAKDAPLTNKYFEAVMDANPDFGDVMRTAREDVQNWRNAPAEARLASSISVGDNPNKTPYRLSQLTRDLVDDLHMLKMAADDAVKLSGEKLAPSENPYLLSRLLRGSYGMADSFIRNGVSDFKTRRVALGTSFEHALKPVAGRINEFRNWIVAKRAQELHSQGRETGLVSTDVDTVAKKYDGDATFQKAFEDVKKWQDSLLQYAVDSGYVSEASASAMRAMNQDYVPMHRIFEIGAGESPVQQSGGGGRGLNVGKAGSLKRLTGSARDIVDPLETMVKNAYSLITASEKSAINKAIGDLANKPGMAKWVEEVAAPKEAVRVELEKVRKELEASGADLSTVPDDLVMQFFQNSGKAPFGENIIKVTNKGESKFYRLNKDLYEAFNALNLDDNSRLIQLLSQPAQVLRAGVTLDPAFGLANVMRDAVGSAVINKYGMLPFEASARGMVALFKNPKLVAEWAASGGEQSFEASFFDRKKMAQFMREKITKALTPAEQALIIVKSPLTALRYISGLAESATRIGEFDRAYKEAIKTGMPEGEARRLASFESRDRQDFAKGGAKTKILRQMAAFWNAGLQGNVAVVRAFKERPTRSTLQGLAYITLPTLGLMAMNWKDEDYWDRPQWERDAFWLMPIGKDTNNHTSFLRIPKPFILGQAFGMMPERMMRFSMKKDPKAFEEVMSRVAADTIPNPMPQTAQVIVSDLLTGKQGWDMWRNRPVVPDALADLPAELQSTSQTSLTAKKIGGALGMSPMKVDHIIAGTTGGLGRQIVHNAIDKAIGGITGEEPTATNVIPGARFFATPAGISSQAVETFYDELSALREKKSAVKITGKAMDSKEDGRRLSMERTAERMSMLRAEAKKAKSQDERQRKYLEIARIAKEAIR